MATKLPRLNVSMTADQHELLRQLGKLQGRSGASFLREMLDAATPMLQASLPVWQAVADQAAAQPDQLRKAVEQLLADVKGNVAQLDMIALIERSAPGANDPADAPGQPSVASAPGASAASSKRSSR